MDLRNSLALISPDLMDVLLPFVLIFTIVYAILKQVPHFQDHDRFQLIIAVVIALMVIIPHVTGTYYYGELDVVEVINQSIPQIALLIVAMVMVLILIGATNTDAGFSDHAKYLKWIALAIVALIFMDNLNYGSIGSIPVLSWFSDPDFQALAIIIIIFGLIIRFVTGVGGGNYSCPEHGCNYSTNNLSSMLAHLIGSKHKKSKDAAEKQIEQLR